MLVARRIGPKPDGLYSLGEEREGVDEYAELFVPRRNVAVPELRIEDESLLRPVGVEGW